MTTWQRLGWAGLASCCLGGWGWSQTTTTLEAQRSVVVKLEAHFPTHGDETAAGMFVGKDQQNAYFITARHALVYDAQGHPDAPPDAPPVRAQSVKLWFHNSPQSVNAAIFDQADPILDLGVVYVPLSRLPPNLPQAVKGNIAANTSLCIIGHPAAGDWSVWQGNVMNETAPGGDVHHFITTTNASLARGYSGGPEFDENGGFLGMQVGYAVTYGLAAPGAEIEAQLRAWQVPTNNFSVGSRIVALKDSDADSIRKVLSRYEDAYNQADAKQLWAVWPNPPAKTKQVIEAYFKSAASIKASLRQGTPEIAANHFEAKVTSQLSQRFTPKQGNPPPARDDDVIFFLKKNNGVWMIVDVK
jgi:Trypsin-like peptidase domain